MKKLIALLCAITMAFAAVGCGKKDNETKTEGNDLALESYPIETDQSLTYFKALPSNLVSTINDYSETEFAQEFMRQTGVKIEYMQPVAGQFNESFNIMLASDELPDIIETAWVDLYLGGPNKAMADDVIIPINEYQKYAPSFFGYLDEHPELRKYCMTDDGDYYGFPLINESQRLALSTGPTVRADWLEDLNLPFPETVDDWDTMLTAFKEQKGATAPLSFNYALITNALMTFEGWPLSYVDGDEIKYGAVSDNFKRALGTLHSWYERGLLDKNIVSADEKTVSNQILTGKTGASLLSGGREIGKFMSDGVRPDDRFELIGTRFPSYQKGEVNKWIYASKLVTGSGIAAISTQCKNPALAAKVLDYAYTKEGDVLCNYGVEGKTFNYVDGEPIYSELITNNPDGLSMSEALSMYVRVGGGDGAFIRREGYINQYYALPQQQQSLDNWMIGQEESQDRVLPGLTPTVEEAQEYAEIMNEVSRYQDEMILKFITGIEPLENFDQYVEKMKSFGLDRAMEIQTGALKRFEQRG